MIWSSETSICRQFVWGHLQIKDIIPQVLNSLDADVSIRTIDRPDEEYEDEEDFEIFGNDLEEEMVETDTKKKKKESLPRYVFPGGFFYHRPPFYRHYGQFQTYRPSVSSPFTYSFYLL